jgi:hypothetical protein
MDLFTFMHGRLWIDLVYVRLNRSQRSANNPVLAYMESSVGKLWMTRSVLQGDGTMDTLSGTKALTAHSKVLMQGVRLRQQNLSKVDQLGLGRLPASLQTGLRMRPARRRARSAHAWNRHSCMCLSINMAVKQTAKPSANRGF